MKVYRIIAAALLVAWLNNAHAQTTGRVVLGFAPGGALDIMSRVVTEALREGLNQPFITENRAGADGRIAIDAVKAAPPDGNTLLFSPIANFGIFPHTQRNLPYDPVKDFIPVSMVGAYTIALAVGPMTPARTLQEFIAWAKANPKLSNFGTPGNGNIPHFTGVLLAQAAGIEMNSIVYKGSVPAILDVIGGQLATVFTLLGDFTTQARAGKLRVLAHSGAQRSSVAPDVPTFKELGYNIEAAGWYGLFAPAGVPGATVDRIGRLVMQAQQTPAVRERMQGLSLEIRLTTPAQFAEIVRNDYEFWGKTVRASGFKAVE